MKNVMLAEPSMIVSFWLGVLPFILLPLIAVAAIVAIVFIASRLNKSKRHQPPVQPPPVVPPTKILPRPCPQCGAALQPDVPEGLCPACLLQRGIATEGGVPPGTPPFVPPTIPDLARLFPQLEILELIGKGGMGAVYKARQPSLDRFVALKILAPRSGGDLDFAGRFTREARALARLSHPNIVAVYDFGEKSGHRPDATPLHYFIMEFVDGPNLRQAGKLAPREAMEIIPQICAALQFAHDEGIVHRDIKPENVLLDKKGRVKIADFGLAKILGQEQKDLRLTGVRDVMGTPHYMAPEQVERPQDVDHRADIYSLGVVFYEMLTGELPLGKFQSPSQKVQVDVRLDEVVLRSLAKEPDLRYQHVSEMGTRVATIAGSAPGESESRKAESGKPEHSVPTRSPFRRGLWAGLLVFVLIVAVASFITFILPNTYVGVARVALATTSSQTYDPYFVQTETEMARSSLVLAQAAPSLDLSKRWSKKFNGGKALTDAETISLMGRLVEVRPVRNTSIIEIRFYNDSAEEAAEIANKIAETYCAFPPGHRGEILDRAVPGSGPVRPNRPLNIVIGVIAGIALGIFTGVVVGLFSLWRSRAARLASSPPVLQKPDRFWRWFAVVVLALISIPFVISILGMLAAIAIPNFVKARQHAQAINAQNLAQQSQTNRPSAATETWSPTITTNERPDLQKILADAKTLATEGRYEEALQRHLWYHNHALEYDQGQTGVRLSFALSDWVELGRHYPKAKQALIEIRDHKTRELVEGRGHSDMFQEVDALNRELQKTDETYTLFMQLETSDPQLAEQCYFWMESALVQKGEYETCQRHLSDPQWRFENSRQSWGQMKGFEERNAARRREQSERYQAMAKTNSAYAGFAAMYNQPTPPPNADRHFIEQTRQLIEILVGVNRLADAESIRDQAVAVLDDPRLKSAVSDAENRIHDLSARKQPSSKPYTFEIQSKDGHVWMTSPGESEPLTITNRPGSNNAVTTDRNPKTNSTARMPMPPPPTLLPPPAIPLPGGKFPRTLRFPSGFDMPPTPSPTSDPNPHPALPEISAADQARDLATRFTAAKAITSFRERDTAMAAIARDAARALNSDLAREALGKMTAFPVRDAAALQAARELVRRGQRAEAIAIAKTITSFTERDAALKELAR